MLQRFIHVGDLAVVKVFAKSTSHRFENWVSVASMRRINDRFVAQCAETPDANVAAAQSNGDSSSDNSSSDGDKQSQRPSAPFSLATPVDFSDDCSA